MAGSPSRRKEDCNPNNDFDDWMKGLPSVSIHPGHFFLLSSLPFCYSAYQNFRVPLDDALQEEVQGKTGGIPVRNSKALLKAGEDVRRVVGSAVAARALRIATAASVGFFGLATAMAFYAAGCRTFGEAFDRARTWAQGRREKIGQLDQYYGIHGLAKRDDPEFKDVEELSEKQELEYLSKKYLPDEDWYSEPEKKQKIKD